MADNKYAKSSPYRSLREMGKKVKKGKKKMDTLSVNLRKSKH